MAPIVLYFIIYGCLSNAFIYESMNMDQLLTEINIKRLPDLRRTNVLIFVILLAVFVDSLMKTIIVTKLSTVVSKPTIDIITNFPFGLIIFMIGLAFLLFQDQTDPADIVVIGLTVLMLYVFCMITATFYIVLFAQDVLQRNKTDDSTAHPMPLFQTILYLCAIIYTVLVYRVVLTNDSVTLPLAGLFIYIMIGILIISNILTFIMMMKVNWDNSDTMNMFCLPSGLISIITFAVILLTYIGKYPEWIMYPIPLIYLYWILTNFALPSNYAIVKSLAMKWM